MATARSPHRPVRRPAAQRPTPQDGQLLVLTFALSLFSSAFLLFLVQPLVGKLVTPLLGGSPAVWITCMLFFQAALLAGFGRDNVRAVAVDETFAMRPDALEETIRADIAAGKRPSAVVATTGTTASTALDPVGAIADVAARHNCWLHVDAAMAGSAMILPECRWMWDGIERADSLVLNPHKWLGAVFDCSLYYVRDPEHLVRVMSTNPSYLQSSADGRVKNFRDWGIPLPEFFTPFAFGIEFVGGLLLLVGFLTRFAAVPLMIVMLVSIIAAKTGEIDSIVTLLGFEEVSYFVMFGWLAIAGPGPVSVDHFVLRAAGRTPSEHGA